MNEQDQAARPAEFKNRTVGLVVFGVIQILMGLFWVLMIPLVLVSLAVSPAGAAAVGHCALAFDLGRGSLCFASFVAERRDE